MPVAEPPHVTAEEEALLESAQHGEVPPEPQNDQNVPEPAVPTQTADPESAGQALPQTGNAADRLRQALKQRDLEKKLQRESGGKKPPKKRPASKVDPEKPKQSSASKSKALTAKATAQKKPAASKTVSKKKSPCKKGGNKKSAKVQMTKKDIYSRAYHQEKSILF